jgi:hypothetical protein
MRATPLLNRSESNVDQQLRVVHDDLGDLTDPQVVLLTIRNSGRAAIASAHYDANEPFPIDLGRPILQLIQVVSEGGPGLKAPPATVENGTLRIGPGLIHRKQFLTFSVLVDGEPKLEVERNLVDVDVKIAAPGPGSQNLSPYAALVTALFGMATTAALFAFLGRRPDSVKFAIAIGLVAIFGAAGGLVKRNASR